MTFRIHFQWPDGTEDSILLSGDAIEDVRTQAAAEIIEHPSSDPRELGRR